MSSCRSGRRADGRGSSSLRRPLGRSPTSDLDQRKGFRTFSRPSSTWPCCMSSDTSVLHPASNADATIIASWTNSPYFSAICRPTSWVSALIGTSVQTLRNVASTSRIQREVAHGIFAVAPANARACDVNFNILAFLVGDHRRAARSSHAPRHGDSVVSETLLAIHEYVHNHVSAFFGGLP